ncbi:MAG: FtsH protease activity modulator HflK [Rhodospirillaceae bacterium]|nr:FtsH protease activity modulator HflK [Rhodospirillaceae bacterium]
MAWKPQGGGPWGSGGGGKDPWGGGGNSGGPGQPDIDELLRRSQEKFKTMMPGGMGSGRGIMLAVLAAIALWLGSGIYRVDSGRQGVVMLFGEFVQTTMPGLHWYFPAPIGKVYTPDVEQVRRVDVGFRSAGDVRNVFGNRAPSSERDVLEESMMLTGDQNIADVDFSVQWKVKDASQFLFNIRDPENTVKLASESAMREVIGQTSLQEAMTSGRQQVADSTRRLLQDILDSYSAGITITQVQLLKVDPPEKVIDAFNEVQRARQDKERKQNEAETYRNKIIPNARGESEQMIQAATAYKERVIKEADGEAKQFLSVYETYKSAKDVTTQRMYLEAMEEVLKGSSKVIIDSNAGGSGVVPYLPLPELQKKDGGKAQ